MMHKRTRIVGVFGLMIMASSLLLAVPVLAEDATFSQKILPLDCVFTTINAGTGELYYVTPQACGVFIPPPGTTTYSATPQSGSGNVSGYSPNRPVFYVPNTTPNGTATNVGSLPWKPLATIQSAAPKPTNGTIKISGSTIAITSFMIVGLIALVVFVL